MAAAAPSSGRSLDPEVAALVERWVRRVSMSGDSRRGVVRLEIGAGRYAGTELVVVAEPDHVSVQLRLPEGAGDAGLAVRLRERLEARGYGADVRVG